MKYLFVLVLLVCACEPETKPVIEIKDPMLRDCFATATAMGFEADDSYWSSKFIQWCVDRQENGLLVRHNEMIGNLREARAKSVTCERERDQCRHEKSGYEEEKELLQEKCWNYCMESLINDSPGNRRLCSEGCYGY